MINTTFPPPPPPPPPRKQLPLPHLGKVNPDKSITHSWEIVMKFIESRWSGKILFLAFVLCLNVCKNRSAARFVGGWYGAQQLCFTPLISKKIMTHTGYFRNFKRQAVYTNPKLYQCCLLVQWCLWWCIFNHLTSPSLAPARNFLL